MRMWKVDPKLLCRKHLLGEHVEMHMFVGCLLKNKSIKGYIDTGLVEVNHIEKRHNELANELIRRGLSHKSDIAHFDFNGEKLGNINVEGNLAELSRRCEHCRALQEEAKS